ncbi:nucleotide sugar dehydrogenase [Microbulbifer thermotolerans]|uniref:nucleotide sugar dehydrogenase n=1 Tax=Microbulbifer thermotolerans TaxID=252514 RepID=UPI00224A7E0A|nr:nucleotide sugar dehydrogenase [Microbulbifer thermotolerans]MCX2840254.1 nucleotide sugar dehydrogenase [Microbulbifer thermotolerans]
MDKELISKLESKEAVIGIVGLGYVGLPLSLSFSESRYVVLGFDIDEKKVETINSGKSYIKHIPNESMEKACKSGFSATSDFSRIEEVDAIILCVPTPLNKYREPDLSYIISTIEKITPYMKRGQILSLESTTYPGTTEEELVPRIERAGFKVGEDVFVVYSPEREDPGNQFYKTKSIPKVCGGYTDTCLKVGVVLYESVISCVVAVSSTKTAEMTKLLENIHRAVNIGLVNEMKVVADAMGIDIYEVIRAAATKPFGFVPYYPGPGLGGHCIPIDPFYLTWKAREYGLHTRFIELAGEVNTSMPDYVVLKVSNSLNDRKKSVKGSRILVLGAAYKKNVDDMRESPSVILIEKLQKLGAVVSYSDPYVKCLPKMRAHNLNMQSVELTDRILSEQDCVIIATDHDAFDYNFIARRASLVVDTRGRYSAEQKNVIRA